MKMLAFSVDALTGFSTAPLRVATVLGLGGALVSFLFGAYVVVTAILGHTVAGWASTVLIVVTMGAVQLLCLGLLGEYIGRMYTHMQGRPSYFIAYDSLLDDGELGAQDVDVAERDAPHVPSVPR
jgi:dolichol-phosphate mannosyltransferase